MKKILLIGGAIVGAYIFIKYYFKNNSSLKAELKKAKDQIISLNRQLSNSVPRLDESQG